MTGLPDDRGPALPVKRVGRRRVITAPAPGSDAVPQAPLDRSPGIHTAAVADEDSARAWGDTPDDNESRLRADVPPHY